LLPPEGDGAGKESRFAVSPGTEPLRVLSRRRNAPICLRMMAANYAAASI
jgi:hypothetical protein